MTVAYNTDNFKHQKMITLSIFKTRYALAFITLFVNICQLYGASSFYQNPALERRDSDTISVVAQDISSSSSFIPRHTLAFGLGGLISTQWALGGVAPVFSAYYDKWLSPAYALEANIRYVNHFVERASLSSVTSVRPNGQSFSATSNLPSRWLSGLWGTDIALMIKPQTQNPSRWRFGIGPSIDFTSALVSGTTTIITDTSVAIVRSAEYNTVWYLGCAACVEFTPPSLHPSQEISFRLQTFVQTALVSRPFFLLSQGVSGGITVSAFFRVHW
jgi:hypothetical protein